MIDPVLVGLEVLRVDDQGVAFPVADRLAVVSRNRDVRIGELASIQVDDAQAIGEAEHHVDHRRLLHHRDRPHARHDHRHAGRIALADAVAIGLAGLAGLGGLAHRGLPGLVELRVGWTEHEVRESVAQIDEPDSRQIERRLLAGLLQVLRSERAVEAIVLVRQLIDPLLRQTRASLHRHASARPRPRRLSDRGGRREQDHDAHSQPCQCGHVLTFTPFHLEAFSLPTLRMNSSTGADNDSSPLPTA